MKTFLMVIALLNPVTGGVETYTETHATAARCEAAAFEAVLGARQNGITVAGAVCRRLVKEAGA